ncbi:MAG: class I SAM-dependent methyltransferase [Alphaproteobacteria bacterium]
MAEVNLLETHPKCVRNVAARLHNKAHNRERALRFDWEYFDGPREQGYGGYVYDGRWIPVARRIIDHFGLKPGDRVLDIGCAKGFLVRDLMAECPGLTATGLDISHYALTHAHPDVAGRLLRSTAHRLPFADGAFDAAICINTVHNLDQDLCLAALREIERVAPERGFVQVDAYRTESERQHFEDWMLTARTYGRPEDWLSLFAQAGYRGDYFWTILEME